MGVLLSALGALLGAALWVGVTRLPIPFFLAGVAAILAGLATGWGMRLGTKGKPSLSLKLTAVALAALSAAMGRYASFVHTTASFKTAAGDWATPSLLDERTCHHFLRTRMTPSLSWDFAVGLLLYGIAGYMAWRASEA